MTDSYHFSWHYVSNTPPGRPFDLAGAITPRADRRFDGAVDAYSDGRYIGRCEFSSIDADCPSEAAKQVRKRIECRIEDRVARENDTSPLCSGASNDARASGSSGAPTPPQSH